MMRELRFLLTLWKTNLMAAMEYRAAFITQVVGMMLNNAVYFLFWVVFFDRFKQVRGWELDDMFILFGVVAMGYGLGAFFFGNVFNLTDIISKGQLDYYLSFPRPTLLHLAASHSITSGLGDATYGMISFLAAGQFSLGSLGRFALGVMISTTVFLSFLVFVQSLAFWLGNVQLLSQQALNAVLTFSLYPISLFDGPAKFILFTILPAAFMGAVPAEFVRRFTLDNLVLMAVAALILFPLAVVTFYRGLRRYESGSGIQIQV